MMTFYKGGQGPHEKATLGKDRKEVQAGAMQKQNSKTKGLRWGHTGTLEEWSCGQQRESRRQMGEI